MPIFELNPDGSVKINSSKSSTATKKTTSGAGTVKAKKKVDLSTVEGLATKAQEAGYSSDVKKILGEDQKLSALQRIGKLVGAFGTAGAVSKGMESGIGAGLAEYPKSIVKSLASATTGIDYNPKGQSYSDVAEKLGIENGLAKFGIGFLGDVLLDPTTYFGGAIAKAGVRGTQTLTKGGLKAIGKVAPDVEAGLTLAAKGAKDAMGKAFVYGYGTSKGITDDVLDSFNSLDKAKEGIVRSNIERLGTGTLSTDQQQELVAKMLAAKRAEFGSRAGVSTDISKTGKELALEAAQSSDPLVQKTIAEQAARSQKIAKSAGIQDPFTIYYPGINKDKINSFFEGTKSLKVGSQDYLKQFRNILTDEQLVSNPAQAFATREWQVVKDNIVKGQLRSLVKTYGKKLDSFASEQAAKEAGYTAIKEKGIFGKPIGYLKETDAKFITSQITPEFSTIDNIAKATGYDAITSLFKRSVTGLFASFHVRNYVSGMIQNFEAIGPQALNPKNIAAGQKVAYKIAKGEKFKSQVIEMGGKQVNIGKALNAFSERFSGSSSYITDIADATRGAGMMGNKILSKERLKETLKTAGLGQESVPFKAARAVGNYIETQQKATAFIASLEQGKTIKEALKMATIAGFDYRALTPFESKILRRAIPFYSFTRKNIELQLKTMGENPQRINQILALFRNSSSLFGDKISDEEKKYLPDYIKNSLGIKIEDTPEGLSQYISGFGSPLEAFADLINRNPVLKGISMMNPMLKAPIEIGIGKDSFRERDLNEVYNAKEYENAPQIIKDLLDIKVVEKPTFTKVGNKLKKTGVKTEYVADPVRLLIARSLFTSRGISYLDSIFNSDLSSFATFLKSTTGIKPYSIDIEAQKGYKEKEQRRMLEDLLIKTGKASEFRTIYQSKNTTQ